MKDLASLYKLLDSITVLFDKLLVVENDKLDAIAANDVEKLDGFMLSEQALTMELRSLDAKREKLQTELGYDKYTLKEIISSLLPESPGDAERLRTVMGLLEQRTEELTLAVECTKKFIELHLQSIDFVLARMGEQRDRENSYQSTGEKSGDDEVPAKFTPRKV